MWLRIDFDWFFSCCIAGLNLDLNFTIKIRRRFLLNLCACFVLFLFFCCCYFSAGIFQWNTAGHRFWVVELAVGCEYGYYICVKVLLGHVLNQLFCLEGLEELGLTIKFVEYNFIHVVLEHALANEEENDEELLHGLFLRANINALRDLLENWTQFALCRVSIEHVDVGWVSNSVQSKRLFHVCTVFHYIWDIAVELFLDARWLRFPCLVVRGDARQYS